MLLTEATRRLHTATFHPSRKVVLVCSFEPLHLATYLQASLIARFPEASPPLITCGYDQLHEALVKTSTEFRHACTLLFLSWDDLHPALSWRSRSPLGPIPAEELSGMGERLLATLTAWLTARAGAETYVMTPPLEWLPFADAQTAHALGPTALAASAVMSNIAHQLSRGGARALRTPASSLHYRDLLAAGCPLTVQDCERVARHVVDAAYPAFERKKALVVDLDGTLWHGVIGEDGPQGIACGPDGAGVAFQVFQKFLLKLKREGILLAVCSKNTPEEVVPVFDQLEMPLRREDFAVMHCTWEPKSSALRAIARELNLGTDDLVFIDDNEAELAEVRAHLPGVATLRTPRHGGEWHSLLTTLQTLCGTWRVSDEDRLRMSALSAMRERERARPAMAEHEALTSSSSLSHLRAFHLELLLNLEAFDDPRSLGLINKTNQFNLTGQRLSTEEWLDWALRPGAFCYSARVTDRFGDFGTIGVITGQTQPDATVALQQCVLSCRAFGRGIETLMLGCLLQQEGWEWVCGPFLRTGKNEPAERFLRGLGCTLSSDGPWRISRQVVETASARVMEETGAIVSAGAPSRHALQEG